MGAAVNEGRLADLVHGMETQGKSWRTHRPDLRAAAVCHCGCVGGGGVGKARAGHAEGAISAQPAQHDADGRSLAHAVDRRFRACQTKHTSGSADRRCPRQSRREAWRHSTALALSYACRDSCSCLGAPLGRGDVGGHRCRWPQV